MTGDPCVLTCPLQGSLSAPGHAVMVGEKRLAQPVPDCLVFCWPFSPCWAQPLSKVTIKWQQLWYLLTPPGAHFRGEDLNILLPARWAGRVSCPARAAWAEPRSTGPLHPASSSSSFSSCPSQHAAARCCWGHLSLCFLSSVCRSSSGSR